MPLSEFGLIDHYFARLGASRTDVALGVGDDCALLEPAAGYQLAISIDTLVEGVHFFPDTDPEALGHKVLAVNLSDLAAMGATPAWVTLALTLPTAEPHWLSAFARGFDRLAQEHGVQLVGGDTTRGPRSITVQIHGLVRPGRALRRDGARAGDLILVTGTLGDAAVALSILQARYDGGSDRDGLLDRLQRPQPRIGAGTRLAGVASAAIDISDGLLSDLGHICERSGVGARIEIATLPLSRGGREYLERTGDHRPFLAGGDDYELCFTLPPERLAQFEAAVAGIECGFTRIGVIETPPGIRCIGADGRPLSLELDGYQHFR